MDDSVDALEQALATASSRLQQRLNDEIEQQRAELDRLNRHCELLRAEATMIEQQARENAARIVAEARQTEAQAQAAAQQILDDAHTRLRHQIGGHLDRAAAEISALRESIVAPATQAGAAALAEEQTRAPDRREEGAVTRLTVRPAISGNERTLLKEKIEQVAGVYAVLFGAQDEASCEMLIAHEPSAKVEDGLVALAPTEIRQTASGPGFIELEIAATNWLRTSEEGGRAQGE